MPRRRAYPGHLPLPGERACRRSRLAARALTPGATLPADRLYAIENGPSGFDPAAPAYFPKQRFLMLMRNERLAALRTDYDEASHTLIDPMARAARPRAATCAPRRAGWRSRRSSAASCRTNCAGRPRCCTATATAFRTWPRRWSRSSIWPRWRRSRTPSARRSIRCAFAATSMSRGWPAWHEFDLLGREIAIGSARLKVVKRIVRCAATERRSRHRHPRPGDSEHADAELRPRRLRRLCRGDRGGEIAAGDRIES